ncbi:MAG: BspA family leucine-rich repeat surface protein [Lachnospiraceae bacterium]|nr:BspA family leucine-rich repeat surface protein [Lachnospiraceae bacterium]
MRSRGKKWNGSRLLSAFLACLMIVSSVSLPARAAEPSVEVTQMQEDASEQPENPEAGTEMPEQPENPEAGTETPEQPENPEAGTETPEQPENPEAGTEMPEQPENPEAGTEMPEQPENSGTENDDRQSANPDEEEGDEDQTGDPGIENDREQPGETDAVKTKVFLSGITITNKEYDGKEAAYTGKAVLKDSEGKAVEDTKVSLLASYAGKLADESVYEETESAPSQAGTYTLTFSLAGEGADQYTLEEAVYSFEIKRKEVWIYAWDVQAVIGRELPAVTELTYHMGANGLVEGDELLTPPSLRYSQENISTDVAGEYAIIPYGADAGNNYSINYGNGKLTVSEEKILYSGTTNDISWKIDQGGKLTIEGTGDYECSYSKDFNIDGVWDTYELPPWCEYGDTYKIKVNSAEVKVTGITATAKMFTGFSNLETVDLSGLNMSKVTDMSNMFARCGSLKSLELSGLDMSSVTSMSCLFKDCSSLEDVNLNGLNTSKVTDMSGLFKGCSSLRSLELSGLDTSSVTSMSGLFEDCSSLENVDLNGLDTSKVIYMGYMFGGCSSLHSLDLRGFDTGNVVNMTGMFRRCVRLESLDLSGWDMGNVKNIRLGDYDIYDTGFLDGCDNLTCIHTPRISYRTNGWVLYLPRPVGGGLWYDDRGVAYRALDYLDGNITLTRKNLNAGKINDISWEIDENGRLTISGTGAYFDGRQVVNEDGKEVETLPPWANRSDVLTAVVNVSEIRSTSNMFYGCTKLHSIDLTGLDTSEVTDMSAMFRGCSSLETLTLTDLDTSGVTDMSAMFRGCSGLKTLTLTGLDTSGVINMRAMFQDCSGLRNLNLDGLDTGSVGGMDSMFRDCSSLESLNLYGLDTGHVGDMDNMFRGCSNLQKLDLSSFDISGLHSMAGMFWGCKRLESVDLSSFDMSGVKSAALFGCDIGQPEDLRCDSLSYIKTPRNYSGEEILPTGGRWYDRSGKEYTQLPSGLAESVELYRSGESEGGQEQYAYVSGITVASRIYDGNAFAYTGTAGVTDVAGNPISGVVLTASYEGTLADGSEYPITDQAPSQAGTYTLSFAMSGIDGDSYVLRNAAYSFQISRRQVTITAPNRTVAAGGQLPELSAVDDYTIDGILTGDRLLKAPAFRYGRADIVTTKPGSYAIIPYGAEAGANYCIRYVKGQLTVGERNSYDLAEAEIFFSDIEYDGKHHVVNPVVKYRDWTLRVGIDYRLWVESGNGVSSIGNYEVISRMGKYTIHITGMGFYYGEQTKTFRVVPGKDMDFGDVLPDDIPDKGWIPDGFWVAGDFDDYTYTGKAIKPAVRVYNNTTLLKEKTDYTISYANNVNANVTPEGVWLENVSATPTITVKGKGNYSGSWIEYFNIRQNDISWSAGYWYTPEVTAAYTGRPQKPQPVFMTEWDRNAKLKNSNYTAQYYRKNDTEHTEPLNAVQEEGEYVIRCTGKGNYAGVAECPLTVTKLKVVGKLKVSKIPDQPYTGSEICPPVTVKEGKTTLTEGEHYCIEYYNYNTEIGTGEVWIEGIPEGGYAGERLVTFKITGTPIKKAVVSGLTAAVYSGTQHKPEPVLTMKKTVNGTQTTETLQKDRDYELSWQKNENAGSATVVITGIGGYTGSMKKTFKIGKYDIAANAGEKFMAALADQSFSYEKGGVKAKPVVTFRADDGSQLTLTEGRDYTLSYKQHTGLTKDGKRAEITVKGKGNFSGTYGTKFTYEIVRQDIGQLTLTAQDKVYQNKKNIYATKVTVTDVNGKVLKAGTDYDKAFTYTYENPTEVQDTAAGKAVSRAAGDTVVKSDIIPVGTVLGVKVAAKEGGNYCGTMKGTYRIAQASIASAKVSISGQAYTGQPVTLNKETITVKSKSGEPLADDQWEIVEDSYKNNVKKGTASVTIRGLDQYGGTKTVKFTIKAQSIGE